VEAKEIEPLVSEAVSDMNPNQIAGLTNYLRQIIQCIPLSGTELLTLSAVKPRQPCPCSQSLKESLLAFRQNRGKIKIKSTFALTQNLPEDQDRISR